MVNLKDCRVEKRLLLKRLNSRLEQQGHFFLEMMEIWSQNGGEKKSRGESFPVPCGQGVGPLGTGVLLHLDSDSMFLFTYLCNLHK
jgi:hypothetical protein